MMSRKSSIIISAVVVVFAFFIVTWFSCNKPSQPYSCDGVVCENGGYCYQDTLSPHKPYCMCPSGFEGVNCATASVDKYLGYWDIHTHLVWSDSVLYIYPHLDSTYTVLLTRTATNTTFFINNFFNNTYYNDIICDIDSTNSSTFVMDTLSDFHEHYNHFQIKWGSGTIYGIDSIVGSMFIRFTNGSTNWQQDRYTYVMTPHKQ